MIVPDPVEGDVEVRAVVHVLCWIRYGMEWVFKMLKNFENL